jgi:hypothetical protein
MIAPRFASFLCLVINIYIWTLAGSSLRFLCDRFCGGRMSRHCTAKRARLGNFPSSGLDRRLPRSAHSVCHPSLHIARTARRLQLFSSTVRSHSFLDAILESRPLSASCLARCKCNRRHARSCIAHVSSVGIPTGSWNTYVICLVFPFKL